MDKDTTNKNLNIHSRKAVIRDSGKRRVVSPVHLNVSDDSFSVGNNPSGHWLWDLFKKVNG